jgi:ABC-type molybdenum transport system ATPase subunit/photorepair protein PhrA
MSYGQRRIIEIFRAILYKPNLLCLDEPYNFIDPQNRKIINELLLFSKDSLSNTRIILTTHLDDQSIDGRGKVYYFNGNFPISRLLNENSI